MSNKMNVYIAGNMLTKDSQLLRAQEKAEIEAMGVSIYNPMDNKEINDKANLTDVDMLCDRIVAQDTKALMHSTHVVIEPQPYAVGTMVELGQLLGYKQLAESLMGIIDRMDAEHVPAEHILAALEKSLERHLARKVYPHYEDIRRVPGITEEGDYRSLGINQYLVGACRQLTGGEPFYDWEEIKEDLKWESAK
ncbi:hypothetical protein [Shewanella algae]|uniref:hypothetical protein n=1 Tax=Shewanella algae TaxID=38313 RepID=UPI003999DEC2